MRPFLVVVLHPLPAEFPDLIHFLEEPAIQRLVPVDPAVSKKSGSVCRRYPRMPAIPGQGDALPEELFDDLVHLVVEGPRNQSCPR